MIKKNNPICVLEKNNGSHYGNVNYEWIEVIIQRIYKKCTDDCNAANPAYRYEYEYICNTPDGVQTINSIDLFESGRYKIMKENNSVDFVKDED